MITPTKCHLWNKEELTEEDIIPRNNFELLKTYVDESHLWRYLLKCKDCGQLYFYEFYEEIDWKEGKDPQYTTLIPVASDEEAKKMAELSTIEILKFSPRLQSDFPSNAEKTKVHWIGK